jgi:hypothetical protein
MYVSVHIYDGDIQLLDLGTDESEAKKELMEIMSGVNFDEESDDVKLFRMNEVSKNGSEIFDYNRDYYQHLEEEELLNA